MDPVPAPAPTPALPFSCPFATTLANDSQFQGALSDIANQHKGQTFLTYALILVVLIWILRAWRLSKAGTWLLRIWVQLWVSLVSWVAILLALPLFVWGQPYKTLLGQVVKALIRHFF